MSLKRQVVQFTKEVGGLGCTGEVGGLGCTSEVGGLGN